MITKLSVKSNLDRNAEEMTGISKILGYLSVLL
jgi:hypothetical protein